VITTRTSDPGAALLARRREALRRHPSQTGLDAVEIDPGAAAPTLRLLFVPPAPGVEKPAVPAGLTASQLLVVGSPGGARLQVLGPLPPPEGAVQPVLLDSVEVAASTASHYTVTLVGRQDVDRYFASAAFSFEVEEPRRFDCAAAPAPAEETLPVPEIDYLAKDFASFRRLMLDRLGLLMPHWRRPSPVDWPVAVVEVLAAAADEVSYHQDAVATEAYLGTARRRTSVRRHARLLDYRLHEGCTARTWVEVRVTRELELDRGTASLTSLGSPRSCIPPGSPAFARAAGGAAVVFETLHPVRLLPERNELTFHTWGARELWLERGCTAATLLAPEGEAPSPGDVLLLEEKRGPGTGLVEDADPERRWVVRLTGVRPAEDPLGPLMGDGAKEGDGGPLPVLEVAWHDRDALPFDLCVAAAVGGRHHGDMAVARANLVLAAHGHTVAGEPLAPDRVPETGRYRPHLGRKELSHSVPYDDAAARRRPAAGALEQSPADALPDAELADEAGERWTPRRDLLSADRFTRGFVVEMTGDGRGRLRFGDGVRGRLPTPGTRLLARYRVGNGTAGNVGRDAVAHLVTEPDDRVLAVRNPLAARGGTDPEPLDRARLFAPYAFRTPERAVTEEDWRAVALRHPEVERAAAARRWAGSWPLVEVAVARRAGRPVDDAFCTELRAFLEPFRLAGVQVRVRGARYVPVEIALTVDVQPEHFPSTVRQRLAETFGNVELPGGRRGFFHRGNLGFGEPVYSSRIVSAAMEVPGVARVEPTLFRRLGRPGTVELERGWIEIGPLEIARLDNDPSAPENGVLRLNLRGGR
jgi:hypothetical protein